MKIITYSRVWYNAPSGANWSYWIWKVDCIDTSRVYVMSFTVKENFGWEVRWKEAILKKKKSAKIIESKWIYTTTGTPKITGVSNMDNMESKEFIQKCLDFLNSKN